MDPDVALAELRKLLSGETDENYHDAVTVFDGLDKWLSAGGFLPAVWQKHRRATL